MRDAPTRNVCIVLLTGIGDAVMGLPLANALKEQDPQRRITWVAEPAPASVLRPHPALEEVVVYEKRRGLAGVLDLRRKLAGRRFDLTLNLNIYFKSIWPTVFSGAPHRLGFGKDRARDGVWLACNDRLPPRPRRHTLDMFLEFAQHLGVRDPAVEWRIPVTPAERREQEALFAPLRGRRVVALVPASATHFKDWVPERYAEVVDALEHDFGYRTILVGGAGERETRIAREITERATAKPAWGMGGGAARRLVWMLDACDLVIAPDTGPVHVARALEVPVIGLYGHSNPWRVGPYRRYEDLWIDRYTDPGEPPDPSLFDPKVGRMEQITVADVLERVERARARYLSSPDPRRAGRPGGWA